jgi:methylenetetrahydrofolate reductase (NADPH)
MIKDIISHQKTPIKRKERALSRLILFFENIIKVPLFGCQHCGECILSSTGFVCSQRCPKRLRNGPCGGTGKGGVCEVFPERKCVWYQVYKRSKILGRVKLLYKYNKIHNWNLEGTAAWLNVFKKRIDKPIWFVKRYSKEQTPQIEK